MRISADKFNAAIANSSRGFCVMSIPESELAKLQQEGGDVSYNTAFLLGAGLGVNPRSLLASAKDVAEFNRHAGNSNSGSN